MRRLLAWGLAALALALATPALAQPPVWIIRDKDSEIVLFGSVHVLPQGLDWRPPALTSALARADDLWFEIPISPISSLEGERLMEAKGGYPPGESLYDHLTPDQAARLKRVADKLSISEAALAHMRPWYAEVMLSVIQDARAGASATDGVEQQIQAAAPPTVRRRAFESVGEQVRFLSGAPPGAQVASLDQTLTEIEQKPDAFRTVVDHWMGADLAGLKADALDPLQAASPELYRRLITERNARWAKVIRRRLRGHGVTVIVVGMGHLIGPGGLPALLRARGLAVEGP